MTITSVLNSAAEPVRLLSAMALGVSKPVLRIWIRLDQELFLGSGIIVPDQNPAKNEGAEK